MNKPAIQNRHAIVILGMHRSGTSALAGVLNLLGVDLSENLLPPGPDNPAGFWEHRDIYQIHKELLQALNSSWDDMRSLPEGWWNYETAQTYKRQIRKVLERDFAGSCFWGVKDPRMCRLLPVWRPLLEQLGNKPYFLIIVRHPLEVAASLDRRNGFAKGKSCLLWLKHLIEAENGTRDALRVFVTYEELLSDWRKLLPRVQTSFGLRWPVSLKRAAPKIDAFLENDLRHHKITDSALIEDRNLAEWIKEAYLAATHATHAGDSRIVKTLRTIEARLKEAGALNEPALADIGDHRIQQPNTDVTEMQDQLSRVRHGAVEREAEILHTQTGLRGKDRGLEELEAELGALPAESAASRKTVGARANETGQWSSMSVNLRRLKCKILTVRYCFSTQHRVIQKSGLFNSTYYLAKNPDVAESGIDPVVHYLAYGASERRNPNPLFDTAYYLEQNPDVAETGINPLAHYIMLGAKERRNPCADFDADAYMDHDPEARRSVINPLFHDMLYGRSASRDPRYRSQFSPTARGDDDYIFHESLEIEFATRKALQFHHPLTVIVPCYVHNRPRLDLLSALIDSLNTAYPNSRTNLNFILIDDASPFSEVRKLYEHNPFCNRPDVAVRFNVENNGFVQTVNSGLKTAAGDVVILNSDTLVFKACFETLQNVAYRENKIGSVTPVSNKATLASIAHWPRGNATVMEQSHAEVAQAIRDFGLITPQIETPTGHGFCMYMTRQALDRVGYFDESYGAGYGEENDWCQKAIQSGFKHVITTETYVFHNDTSSFRPREKQRLTDRNRTRFLDRFPHYILAVAAYVKQDPLKLHRLLLALRISEIDKKSDQTQTILYILHDDISAGAGGTQEHVNETAASIHQYGPYECLVLCPRSRNDPSKVWLYYFSRHPARNLKIPLTYHQLLQLLPYILGRTDILHLHHGSGWPQEVFETICAVNDIRKIFTFHDFPTLGVSSYLLYNNQHLCRHIDDPEDSRKCFRERQTGDRFSIESKLTNFDCILAPSQDTKQWIQQIVKNPALTARIRVLPHHLDFAGIPFTQSSAPEAGQKKIVFLGHGTVHKGIKLFNKAYYGLLQTGFRPEIWGDLPHAPGTRAKSFFGWKELRFRQTAEPAFIVVLPSIGPETFSYTLYEALFVLQVPVVVGPFGNPARVAREYGVGIAMPECSSKSLIEAVQEIDRNYETYKSAVDSFKKQNELSFSKNNYFKAYIPIIDPEAVQPSRSVNTHKTIDHVMEKATGLADLYPFTALFISGLHGSLHGSWRYRVKHPAALLQQTGCSTISRSHTDSRLFDDLIKADVIIFHRAHFSELIQDVVLSARSRHIPLIFDSDDLVFIKHLERYFPFWNDLSPNKKTEYSNMTRQLELTARACDTISCSSDKIAEYARFLGKPAHIMRNFVFETGSAIHRTQMKRNRNETWRIGYFSGSNTHDSDFNWIAPALGQFMSENPETRLTMMGQFQADDFIRRYTKQIDREPYGDYDSYLTKLNACDIAIVPLCCMNDFTRAKSAVKFLEAGLQRVPVIATPIPEMRHYITHGENGWLPGDLKDWPVCLNHARDTSKRNRAGERAYRTVLDSGSGSAVGTKLHQILQNIIDYKKNE